MNDTDLTNRIDKCILKLKQKFCDIVHSRATEEELLMFHFFREKYLQFVLYKLLIDDEWLSKFSILWEYPTQLKFKRNGKSKKDTSGHHDLVIADEPTDRIFFGFELFLGYEHHEKHINSKKFREHLQNDYNKLSSDKNIKKGYLLNFFFRGNIPNRNSDGRTKAKLEAYEKHLHSCKKTVDEMKGSFPCGSIELMVFDESTC